MEKVTNNKMAGMTRQVSENDYREQALRVLARIIAKVHLRNSQLGGRKSDSNSCGDGETQ